MWKKFLGVSLDEDKFRNWREENFESASTSVDAWLSKDPQDYKHYNTRMLRRKYVQDTGDGEIDS